MALRAVIPTPPLDKCPFCAGKAFLYEPKGMFSDQFVSVICTRKKCGASGPRFHAATCKNPAAAAIKGWNKRK